MYADVVRWSLGADGRVPRLAQRRVMPGSKENDSPDHFLAFSPLADPRLVLPPQLYGRTFGEGLADLRQMGGEGFLKAARSSGRCP